MGGRDHSCETCGYGGFGDPDGRCICPPETGQQSDPKLAPRSPDASGVAIPDEAVEAGEDAYLKSTSVFLRNNITAALTPHLERAWWEQEGQAVPSGEGLASVLTQREMVCWSRARLDRFRELEAAIRADERAQAAERIEAKRLTPDDQAPAVIGFNAAIDTALAALKGEHEDS